jgi:hypothetical protein
MSTSIHDQELDTHFGRVESDLYSLKEEPKTDTVYFDFKNPNTSLLTSTLLYKPHRS